VLITWCCLLQAQAALEAAGTSAGGGEAAWGPTPTSRPLASPSLLGAVLRGVPCRVSAAEAGADACGGGPASHAHAALAKAFPSPRAFTRSVLDIAKAAWAVAGGAGVVGHGTGGAVGDAGRVLAPAAVPDVLPQQLVWSFIMVFIVALLLICSPQCELPSMFYGVNW
jgi:hypothetical protein